MHRKRWRRAAQALAGPHPQETSLVHAVPQQLAQFTPTPARRATRLAREPQQRRKPGNTVPAHKRDEAAQVSLHGLGQHEITICERPRYLSAAITSSNFVSASFKVSLGLHRALPDCRHRELLVARPSSLPPTCPNHRCERRHYARGQRFERPLVHKKLHLSTPIRSIPHNSHHHAAHSPARPAGPMPYPVRATPDPTTPKDRFEPPPRRLATIRDGSEEGGMRTCRAASRHRGRPGAATCCARYSRRSEARRARATERVATRAHDARRERAARSRSPPPAAHHQAHAAPQPPP